MRHEHAVRVAASSEDKAPDFSGHWVNQYKSTMDLVINESDVTGSYTSASSASGGPVTGPLKGYIAGDRISFMVLWPKGSITAWVGQMIDDQVNPKIKTLWHLVTEVPDIDEPDRLWVSVLAGADDFHRA